MDDDRKAFPLRISKSLYDQVKAWADQEMRSVNGQIEYLLREAVRRRTGRIPDQTESARPEQPSRPPTQDGPSARSRDRE